MSETAAVKTWEEMEPRERDAWAHQYVRPEAEIRVFGAGPHWREKGSDHRAVWASVPHYSASVVDDYELLSVVRKEIGRCSWDDFCDALEAIWEARQKSHYFDKFIAFIGVPVGLYEPGDYTAALWAIRHEVDYLREPSP